MQAGDRFQKLSGSGNDFVAFDRLGQGPQVSLPSAADVRALCRRGVGVGADGVLVLVDDPDADFRLVYYNADGGRAELCGNASLCSVRLAVEAGRGGASGVRFITDAGPMTGRLTADGLPEIDLAPARELATDRTELWDEVGGPAADEHRLGFARVGVPHVVILCDAVGGVPILERAPSLRSHRALADGANVNFVSAGAEAGQWMMRTFERGVEAETLACGTGSVATALLLESWGLAAESEPGTTRVTLGTSSGLPLRVTLRRGEGGVLHPSLAGSARIVYRGELAEI